MAGRFCAVQLNLEPLEIVSAINSSSRMYLPTTVTWLPPCRQFDYAMKDSVWWDHNCPGKVAADGISPYARHS
jgi:hypothetical protein